MYFDAKFARLLELIGASLVVHLIVAARIILQALSPDSFVAFGALAENVVLLADSERSIMCMSCWVVFCLDLRVT